MFRIPRSIQKRDCTLCDFFFQTRHGTAVFSKLYPIALLEFDPSFRVVTEPFSEFRTRRDVLQPKIDVRLFLREASWPKSVDQDSGSVLSVRFLIYTLNPDTDVCGHKFRFIRACLAIPAAPRLDANHTRAETSTEMAKVGLSGPRNWLHFIANVRCERPFSGGLNRWRPYDDTETFARQLLRTSAFWSHGLFVRTAKAPLPVNHRGAPQRRVSRIRSPQMSSPEIGSRRCHPSVDHLDYRNRLWEVESNMHNARPHECDGNRWRRSEMEP